MVKMVVLGVSIFFSGCQWVDQLTKALPVKSYPMVLYNEEVSPSTQKLAQEYGFQKAYLIYSWFLDRNDDGIWDGEAQMDEWIAYWKLDSSFSGVISLDWEGKALDKLAAGDKIVREEFLKALRALKKRFPKAKLGYYGIPQTIYWGGNPPSAPIADSNSLMIDAVNKNYQPVLDEVDVLMPSIYQFYPNDSTSSAKEFNTNFVHWNAKNVVRMNLKKKLIYFFVSPRYHDAAAPASYRNVTIPSQDWIDQNKVLLSYPITGLWDWTEDSYYLKVSMEQNYNHNGFVMDYGSNKSTWAAGIEKSQIQAFEDLKSSMTSKKTSP